MVKGGDIDLARPAYDSAEIVDYFGRDHSGCIVQYDGVPYYVKQSRNLYETQKELLAHNLVSRFMNVPHVILPDARLLAALGAVTNTRMPEVPVEASSYHLVRLCQSYQLSMLPIRDLTQAIAAEIVFSTWIGRRDAHNSNRVYIAGVPVFFDFGVAFDVSEAGTSSDFFREGFDSGFAGNWRLWEFPKDKTIETREIRDIERGKRLAIQPVHDASGFWRHVDDYRRIIEGTANRDLRRIVRASISGWSKARATANLLVKWKGELGERLARAREIMTSG
jgi:hypothetical protein